MQIIERNGLHTIDLGPTLEWTHYSEFLNFTLTMSCCKTLYYSSTEMAVKPYILLYFSSAAMEMVLFRLIWLSLAASNVVILTIFDAASNENFFKMTCLL